MSLNRILEQQASFVNIDKYVDELQILRQIYAIPSAHQAICRELSLKWMNSLNDGSSRTNNPEDAEYMTALSIQFRNEGNAMFKKKNRNIFQVANLYTKAILTAPIGQALAIAHANRAVTMLEIGYYQVAYDDCVAALEHGHYPDHMLAKLLVRQAHCAWKLKNLENLHVHLNALDKMPLNEKIQKQCQELHAKMDYLANLHVANDGEIEKLPSRKCIYKIVQSNGTDGAHAVAMNTIRAGELIFREKIATLISVEDWCMCQECARTQIVPFPCTSCNRIVYCSIKCRNANNEAHRYECKAFDKNIPANIGIGALALRIFLRGLPQIIPLVKNRTCAEEIWEDLTENGLVIQNKDIEYSQTLRMVTHLDKMSKRDVIAFALLSRLIVLFLKEDTGIFKLMETTQINSFDWELVSAAILLRHIGQLIVNGHAYITLVPVKDSAKYNEFSFLSHTLWSGPFCVQRGKLHRFSNYQQVAAVNLPHLSLLNHSCVQFIETKFNGQFANVYAVRDIPAGKQIYNCYTTSCRKMLSKTRRENLKNTYNFVCQCSQCLMPNPDAEYEKFHRYRCENSVCKEIYVPRLPELHTLEWWHEDIGADFVIKCTVCGSIQNMNWLTNFENLLGNVTERSMRCELYVMFSSLNNWLVGNHKLKMHLGTQLFEECFVLLNDGIEFDAFECDKLALVIRIVLQGLLEESHPKCLAYAAKMTYLWDLIALNKCSCTQKEMNIMLAAAEMLSDEYKEIFLNYFKNYMESFISK